MFPVEDGNGLCNKFDLVEGTHFDRSFPSPYFIDNPNHATLVAFGSQRRAPEGARCITFPSLVRPDQKVCFRLTNSDSPSWPIPVLEPMFT